MKERIYICKLLKPESFLKAGELKIEIYLAKMDGEVEKAIILEIERKEIFANKNNYEIHETRY